MDLRHLGKSFDSLCSTNDEEIGNVPYRIISWDTNLIDPNEAEIKFVDEVRKWVLKVSNVENMPSVKVAV